MANPSSGGASRRSRRAKHNADFELAQPDRSGPKGKSLIDIAAERQAALTGIDIRSLEAEHVEFPPGATRIKTRTSVGDAAEAEAEDDAPAWQTAALYATTLTMVHFTLDVAVHHQYAQDIDWPAIATRLATILPAFAIIVFVLHADALKRRFPLARQLLFLVFACVAGAFLVRAGNRTAYMAVMRRAPPLGALLIWAFVEMSLPFALVALAANAAYAWWHGFSVM